jgi:hypothetical protein
MVWAQKTADWLLLYSMVSALVLVGGGTPHMVKLSEKLRVAMVSLLSMQVALMSASHELREVFSLVLGFPGKWSAHTEYYDTTHASDLE